jgi:hypothetical protein
MGELDRERLLRFLGMLGSSEPGERANAASFAHRVISEAGLTWKEVLEGIDADGTPLQAVANTLRRDIGRYRRNVSRLEKDLETCRRYVHELKEQLEHERKAIRNERSAWSNRREALRETVSTVPPRNRPPGWGSDLFGNEPARPRVRPFSKASGKEAVRRRYLIAIWVLLWAITAAGIMIMFISM